MKIKFPLDKTMKVWYNISINERPIQQIKKPTMDVTKSRVSTKKMNKEDNKTHTANKIKIPLPIGKF
jgi:hypothetical protein